MVEGKPSRQKREKNGEIGGLGTLHIGKKEPVGLSCVAKKAVVC